MRSNVEECNPDPELEKAIAQGDVLRCCIDATARTLIISAVNRPSAFLSRRFELKRTDAEESWCRNHGNAAAAPLAICVGLKYASDAVRLRRVLD